MLHRTTTRIICAALLTVALFSFNSTDTTSKATAEVMQMQGLYVFTDSKPVAEYDYLGTVNTAAIVWKARQYSEIRDVLIKKVKKDFPTADGVIFSFTTGGKDKADAIKFK